MLKKKTSFCVSLTINSSCSHICRSIWCHNGSLMARYTHGQVAGEIADKWTEVYALFKVASVRSHSFLSPVRRKKKNKVYRQSVTSVPSVMLAGCNLAVVVRIQRLRSPGRGVRPSAEEWTSAIYTAQVYNHGFHVVAEPQGCNLVPALCRALCCTSRHRKWRCLHDEILLAIEKKVASWVETSHV